MKVLRFILLFAALAVTANCQQDSSEPLLPPWPTANPANAFRNQPESQPPASCPVTRRPASPFVPPQPYWNPDSEMPKSFFFWGTEKLWTELPDPAIWAWRPHETGHEQELRPLTEKIFWQRVGYDWRAEPSPKLNVTGRRLDIPAPPMLVSPATNAFTGFSNMLVGVYVPTPGCWEVTGDYQGDKLSFVVWVVPFQQAQ